MKNKKKAIIIAVIVLAVAVYLLWKKGVLAKATNGMVASEPSAANTDPVDAVIAVSGMSNTDANYVRSFARKVESDPASQEAIERKALGRGFTYWQMLVLDAIWTKYYDNSTSDFKAGTTDSTKAYVWKVQSNIKNM